MPYAAVRYLTLARSPKRCVASDPATASPSEKTRVGVVAQSATSFTRCGDRHGTHGFDIARRSCQRTRCTRVMLSPSRTACPAAAYTPLPAAGPCRPPPCHAGRLGAGQDDSVVVARPARTHRYPPLRCQVVAVAAPPSACWVLSLANNALQTVRDRCAVDAYLRAPGEVTNLRGDEGPRKRRCSPLVADAPEMVYGVERRRSLAELVLRRTGQAARLICNSICCGRAASRAPGRQPRRETPGARPYRARERACASATSQTAHGLIDRATNTRSPGDQPDRQNEACRRYYDDLTHLH